MTYEWKNKPIEEALKGMKCIPHLKAVGFNTAGDIVDSSPEAISAANYIGLKRAQAIRSFVLLDALKDAERNTAATFHEVEVIHEHLPMSYQIALFVALGLSLISFFGFLLEVTK